MLQHPQTNFANVWGWLYEGCMDSAIHRIVIFSSFVKSVVDCYNSY
jgi:hypothetical protein